MYLAVFCLFVNLLRIFNICLNTFILNRNGLSSTNSNISMSYMHRVCTQPLQEDIFCREIFYSVHCSFACDFTPISGVNGISSKLIMESTEMLKVTLYLVKLHQKSRNDGIRYR